MQRKQKILTISLWGVMVVAMLAMIASGMRSRWQKSAATPEATESRLQVMHDAPPFSLIDQNGKAFSNKDLAGQVWIADFVFTRCAGPCPLMTARMAQLQKTIPNPNIKLVSFSLDPEYDTPAVLKAYAQKHGADESRWSMATGQTQVIYSLAQAMHIGVTPATVDSPITHSTYFILVDGQGKIRGYYSGLDENEHKKLAADAAKLAG